MYENDLDDIIFGSRTWNNWVNEEERIKFAAILKKINGFRKGKNLNMTDFFDLCFTPSVILQKSK